VTNDNYAWIELLDPDQAEAALVAIQDQFKTGMTAREATELHRVQRRLQAKIDGR
jgi:hypothetical protein